MSDNAAYTEQHPLKREPQSSPNAAHRVEPGSRGLGGYSPPHPIQNGYHGSGSESEIGADAPLDFSMKSRTKKRELEMVEHDHVKRRVISGRRINEQFDNNSRSPETLPCVKTESPQHSPPDEDSGKNGNGDDSCTRLGEPPTALPGALPGAVGAAMPGMGLLPNAFAASLPLYMDPRRMQQQIQQQQQQMQQQQKQQASANSSGKIIARPFKAYPKEALSLPLGYYGIPGMLPFPSIDSVTAQAMGMNSEELFNQYRMYVLKCQAEQARQTGKACGGVPQPNMQLPPLPQQLSQQQQQQTPPPQQLLPHQQPQQLPPLPQQSSPAVPGPNSQVSPSAKSTTSETSSTTARSTSSSPTLSTTCTTPTSPGGADPCGAPPTPGSGGDASTTPSRKPGQTMPDERKDEAYWERRRKNNEAAKRSRDSRRAKEDEIAIRAAFLEQENLKLRVEVAALKNETAKLRCMLYNS